VIVADMKISSPPRHEGTKEFNSTGENNVLDFGIDRWPVKAKKKRDNDDCSPLPRINHSLPRPLGTLSKCRAVSNISAALD
jgi:hypothetical protein